MFGNSIILNTKEFFGCPHANINGLFVIGVVTRTL
jgi:hypothetical protein